jgi:hypothetical protein
MAWDGYPEKKWLGHPGEFWIGMAMLVICWIGAAWTLRADTVSGAWKIVVGLVPTLPMLIMMRGYLRMMREQDELHRRVQLEATAVATCLTIVFAFSAWFLEVFSGVPPVNIQWAGIVLFFSYAVSAGVAMRRYT